MSAEIAANLNNPAQANTASTSAVVSNSIGGIQFGKDQMLMKNDDDLKMEDKSDGKHLSDMAKTSNVTTTKPAGISLSSLSSFNSEDFLSRVNMNEKINNILRSPTKNSNGVRQRSVFTTITPVSCEKIFSNIF